MPELYSNQVKLNAAGQPRASAPKMDDSLGRALSSLANTMDSISNDIMKNQDINLRMKVDAREKEAMNLVKNADPKDFNYESTLQQARDIYQSAFDGVSEATITRFYRNHPDNDTLFSIGVDTLAADKSRESQYYSFETNLGNMASEVALGRQTEDWYKQQIDQSGLTNVQKERIKYRLADSVSEYKIMAALSHNTKNGLALAERELTNNKTMTPERRAYFASQIASAMDRLGRTYKEQQQQEHDLLVDTYLTRGFAKGWADADTFASDLLRFTGTEKESAVIFGVKINTIDPKSEYYVTRTQLNAIYKDMKNSRADTPDVLNYKADINHKAENLLEHFENMKKEDVTSFQLSDSQTARTVLSSGVELSDSARKKLTEIADTPYDVISNAINANDRLDIYQVGAEYNQGLTTYADYTPNAMVLAVLNGESDTPMYVASALAREELDKSFLTNDLEQKEGSESWGLTNAFVVLSAIAKDSETVTDLGLGRISQDALNGVFVSNLQNMQLSGTYNEQMDIEKSNNYLDVLLEQATGKKITDKVRETESYKNLNNMIYSSNFFYLTSERVLRPGERQDYDFLPSSLNKSDFPIFGPTYAKFGPKSYTPSLNSGSRNILYPRTSANKKWSD